MIIIPPPVRYPRKRSREKKRPTPIATGPVLVAAAYDVITPSLTLTFDRAVALSGEGGVLNAETITVLDGVDGIEQLNAPDAAGAGTTTLVVTLFPNAAWEGSGVTMTCGGGTGIVSADDSTPWAGVSGLVLPFP